MRFSSTVCVASLALVLLFAAVAEARTTRHHGRHHSRRQQEEEPAAKPVEQEEPSIVPVPEAKEPEPVVEMDVASAESSGSAEKSRPVTRRKAVLCQVESASSKHGKADTKTAKDIDDQSFEIQEPERAVSIEIPSSEEMNIEAPSKASKPVKTPKGKVVKASSEESQSVSEEDESDEDDASGSAAVASLEEPAAPKAAVSMEDIPEFNSKAVESAEKETPAAVESEEEKPKARRSKHHRKDVRRIERPHRRRVVFRSSDEDDE